MEKSSKDLVADLQRASQLVEVGATYRHYKSPDMTYEVVALAIEEASLTTVVVYKALYGEGLTFTRPISVWVEEVEFEGGVVPRFSKV